MEKGLSLQNGDTSIVVEGRIDVVLYTDGFFGFFAVIPAIKAAD